MIYNITPPEKNARNLGKLLDYHSTIIRKTKPEGVGIYDIIEEISQKDKPRPFSQKEYMNTYEFAKQLREIFPNLSIIVYRSVKEKETYEDIVKNIQDNQDFFSKVVVICNSANNAVHTNTLIQKILASCSVSVGCVLLYDRPNEQEICRKRIDLGVSFFISQLVTRPEKILPFLHEFSTKIWVTIVPIENAKTLKMIHWLCRNETNTVDLETYPQNLIEARFPNLCFETISSISKERMIDFIQRFI